MATDDLLPRQATEEALVAEEAASHPPPGKLETFAVLGAFIGTVPFPWVPDALARRVRGALVHDVAVRHGIALSSVARRTLADPTSASTKKGALGQAFGYLGRKLLVRFGPLALLPPIRAALETYVLGYLLDRYLSRRSSAAPSQGRRMDGEEARVVRAAIDRSVLSVVSPERGLAWPTAPLLADDSRDELTQVLDSILGATTTIPSWLLGRLATAFDEELPP
jgi:hypothetical protein